MGNYQHYQAPQRKSDPWSVHPIWRGIGCFMMLLIPIMSYAASELLVEQNKSTGWVVVPVELARTVTVPLLGDLPHFYETLAVTILLMVLGFGALTVIFAVFWGAVGPSRYGPMDARPIRRSDRPPKRRTTTYRH